MKYDQLIFGGVVSILLAATTVVIVYKRMPPEPKHMSVAQLVDLLTDPSEPYRKAAYDELRTRGPDIIPELETHLHDRRKSQVPCGADCDEVGGQVASIIPQLLRPGTGDISGWKGAPTFYWYYGLIGRTRYVPWALQVTEDERALAYLRWYCERIESRGEWVFDPAEPDNSTKSYFQRAFNIAQQQIAELEERGVNAEDAPLP